MQLCLPAGVSLASLMVVTHLRAQVMSRHNIQSRSKSRNFITDVEGRTLEDSDCPLFRKMFFQNAYQTTCHNNPEDHNLNLSCEYKSSA
jgi:hypothetical protein